MRSLIASPLGLLVGLSLGALGGGGSILAVPALVHGVGESAQAATGTSLVVVGAASLVGLAPHWRKGHVRVGVGLLFALAGLGGSAVGTWLNRGVDAEVLLLAFAGFMIVAGIAMLRSPSSEGPSSDGPSSDGPSSDGAAPGSTEPDASERCDAEHDLPDPGPSSGGTAVATLARPDSCATRTSPIRCRTLKVLVAGSVVGVLTGFFGVGGGFVIVPGLVLSLGLSMPVAVGTSLVVITANSVAALALRSGNLDIDWGVTVPFLAMAAVGTLIGGRVAERVDPDRLRRAFVWLLAAVAVFTGTSAVIALVG